MIPRPTPEDKALVAELVASTNTILERVRKETHRPGFNRWSCLQAEWWLEEAVKYLNRALWKERTNTSQVKTQDN